MKNHQMTKLHRAGFYTGMGVLALDLIILFVNAAVNHFSGTPQHHFIFSLFLLIPAIVIGGLSWKWAIVGGSCGLVAPIVLFFFIHLTPLYLYLFGTTICLLFISGVLLLAASIKHGSWY